MEFGPQQLVELEMTHKFSLSFYLELRAVKKHRVSPTRSLILVASRLVFQKLIELLGRDYQDFPDF